MVTSVAIQFSSVPYLQDSKLMLTRQNLFSLFCDIIHPYAKLISAYVLVYVGCRTGWLQQQDSLLIILEARKLRINVPTDLVPDGEFSLSDLQIPHLTVSPCGGERDLVCLPLPRRAITLSD